MAASSHSRNRRLAGGLSALGLGAALALGGIGWIGSQRAIRPRRIVYPWSLDEFPDLTPEPVTLLSGTGITIAGRFFRGPTPTTIVLSHGFGDNQDQMLPWTQFLHRAGFSVFTYDMRHRGASGGDYVTLGALEQTDLGSVIDYVVNRSDVDASRIGAFGVSLGASVAIMAAARDTRIRGVVGDCGFSDAAGVVASSFEHFIHLPAFPFAPLAVKIAEWRTGAKVYDVRPMEVIGRISPRPIFLIHGTADVAVPPENSERNLARAGEPKMVWWVEGAGHVGAWDIAGAEYETRIVEFFREALG